MYYNCKKDQRKVISLLSCLLVFGMFCFYSVFIMNKWARRFFDRKLQLNKKIRLPIKLHKCKQTLCSFRTRKCSRFCFSKKQLQSDNLDNLALAHILQWYTEISLNNKDHFNIIIWHPINKKGSLFCIIIK